MALIVRPADQDDVDFLTDVAVVSIRHQGRWSPDDEAEYRAGYADWTRELLAGSEEGSSLSVLEVDGERVGRLRVVRTADLVELAGIQLMPDHQGHGIGAEVLDGLVVEAAGRGVPLELLVDKDNPRAQAFYERHGLHVVAESDTERRMRLDPR